VSNQKLLDASINVFLNNLKGVSVMKKLLSIIVVLFAVIILSGFSFAQEGNYYTVTTWKISIPAGGSDAELNKIMKEFYDKVASKNGIVVNEKVLQGSSISDMRDWVFIAEYANRNSIKTVSDIKKITSVDADYRNREERERFRDTFWEFAEIYSDDIFME